MKQLSVLAASIFLATSAQSDTVSFSFSNSLQNTEIFQSGSLGLFNLDLGTLNSATLNLGANSAGTISLTLGGSSPTTVAGTSSIELDFSSSLAGLQTILDGDSPDIVLSMTTGALSLNPGQTVTVSGLTDNDTRVLNLSTLLNTVSQQGGGQFDVGCFSLTGFSITGGGGFASGGPLSTQAACGAQIVYDYTPRGTPVPEPTSLALVGLALAGIGAASRRRRA